MVVAKRATIALRVLYAARAFSETLATHHRWRQGKKAYSVNSQPFFGSTRLKCHNAHSGGLARRTTFNEPDAPTDTNKTPDADASGVQH